jgi:hypothetical protein
MPGLIEMLLGHSTTYSNCGAEPTYQRRKVFAKEYRVTIIFFLTCSYFVAKYQLHCEGAIGGRERYFVINSSG